MKTFYFRPIFLLAIFFLPFQDIKASHIMGGEITWECTGTNQYRFILTLYRDCTGTPQSATVETIMNTAGANIVCTKISTIYYNPECNAPSCIQATVPYAGAVEEHVYRSAPITLNGTPPPTGWDFSWTSCCRPSGVTNLSNSSGQSFTLRAFMYPYIATGNTLPNAANTCYDNSPTFYEKPRFVFCTNTNQTYQTGATDVDGDSLHIAFEAALGNSLNQGVNYAANYSYAQPLAASSNQTLNSETGKLSFNSTTQGKFAVCTKVEQWRHNQLIGEVYRDMIIVIKSCTPPSGLCGGLVNNPPSLNVGWVPGHDTLLPVYDANNNLVRYEVSVPPGKAVKFNLVSQDVDLNPSCSPQVISFDGQGTQFSAGPSFNSLTNCPAGVNCATMSSNNTGGVFTSSLSNSVQFDWTPQCQTWGANEAKKSFDFYFSFSDNGCPLPEQTSVFVRINVVNPTLDLISASSKTLCPNGIVTLNGSPNMAGYSWSNGASGQSIAINHPGTYTLTATDSSGCIYVAQTTIDTLNLYTTVPDICLVTLDTATGFNTVIWERPNKKGVAAYVIFRALGSSSFVPIDTVKADLLSVYIDSNSNQTNAQYNYYLALLDSCGSLNSSAVFTHAAPFLMAGFVSATQVGLSWVHYVGRTPDYYIIYRSDSANASYQKIDSVNYPATAFIDSNLPATTSFSYRLGAVMDSSCFPTAKAELNQAISNTAQFAAFSIPEISSTAFIVYPNPSDGVLYLSNPFMGKYSVYAATGALLQKGEVKGEIIHIETLPGGVYLLELIEAKTNLITVQRIIVK
jgi:hypothetical protein